jgi:bacteriocin-like protein
MPEIIRNEPIELSDDELEAVSGGQGGNGNFSFGNFLAGANFTNAGRGGDDNDTQT